ncbi:hypothetical protein [uncultured Clostridium sp.]|uniref:hypothetical protein n=1 Tax=uncultured Clostridium sp. TaxID=59620 RepID=UPI0025E31C71|nr:hypothetical protein [uncultured Clostridium sp.]
MQGVSKKGYVLINVMATLMIITLISALVFKIINNNLYYQEINYQDNEKYSEPLGNLENILTYINGYFKDKKEILLNIKKDKEGIEFDNISLAYEKDRDKFVLGYIKKEIRYEDIYLRYKEIGDRIILVPEKEILDDN